MTSNARPGGRVLGSLRSADGRGIVRMEDRFDTDPADLWVALTDPRRLARWYGEIDGDLRVGGVCSVRLDSSGWEGTYRIEACEPPERLLVTTLETGEADDGSIEVTLTADGDGTLLVWEERGMPVDMLAEFGAGIQVHVEDLGAHLAGRGRVDAAARWKELLPAYRDLVESSTRRADTGRDGWTKVKVVGARGFEPPTSSSRTMRATWLRHAPTGSIARIARAREA